MDISINPNTSNSIDTLSQTIFDEAVDFKPHSLTHSSLLGFNNHPSQSNQFNSSTLNQTTISDPHITLNRFTTRSKDNSRSSSRHSRQSSVAESDTSDSHRSVKSNSSYTSNNNNNNDDGNGGVKKRTTSTRLARSDSSPYSRESTNHQQGKFNSEKLVEELVEKFDNSTGMDYNYSSSDDSDWDEEDYQDDDDDDNFGESGSKTKVNDKNLDNYLPKAERPSRNVSKKPLDKDSGFEGEQYEGPHGTTIMLHGGKNSADIAETLTQVAIEFSQANGSAAKDKAKSIFLHTWLGCSYELCDEGNASRQALYGAYAHTCEIYGVKPINSAGFGKAIRHKFVDIKTRRLGQRGASRYHYCGIRPTHAIEASLLVKLTVEEAKDDPVFPVDENGNTKHRRSTSSHLPATPATPSTARPKFTDNNNSSTEKQPELQQTRHRANKSLSISVPPSRNSKNSEAVNTAVPKRRGATLPDGIDLPPTTNFPSIEEIFVSGFHNGLDPASSRIFWREFSSHCKSLLDTVRGLRFDQFEILSRSWWTSMDSSRQLLVQNPLISSLIYRADAAIYDEILEFLICQLTKPMSTSAFASLRSLGDHMERIQTVALSAFEGLSFTSPKIELAARFGHLVNRYLGLTQLIQALSGIISNPNTMNEMISTWETTDLENIKNQSALVSNCDHRLLTNCFESFNFLLHNIGPIENVIRWHEQCFETCLASTLASGGRQISPRSLLLRWSFVGSQIMRDLTLRSAPAFGSFQIFGLFFEEMLSMQVLRKVALQITAINPLAAGTNVPFPGVSPMSAVGNASYPIDPTSNLPPQELYLQLPIDSNYSQNLAGVTGVESTGGGLNDHLSLLDQFSPKTQEMFRQFAISNSSTTSSNNIGTSSSSNNDNESIIRMMDPNSFTSFSTEALNEQHHLHTGLGYDLIQTTSSTTISTDENNFQVHSNELNEFDLIQSMHSQQSFLNNSNSSTSDGIDSNLIHDNNNLNMGMMNFDDF